MLRDRMIRVRRLERAADAEGGPIHLIADHPVAEGSQGDPTARVVGYVYTRDEPAMSPEEWVARFSPYEQNRP